MIIALTGIYRILSHSYFEFNYMADSLVIDKQSKLFQKFIQSKAQKDQQGPPLPGNQTS
jgi:hypothetical protein